jgi:uncharacterized protein YacL
MKLKRLFSILWITIGMTVGALLSVLLLNLLVQFGALAAENMRQDLYAISLLLGLSLGGAAGFFTVNPVYSALENGLRWLQSRPLTDLIAGGAGLISGLMIAFFLTRLTAMIRNEWLALLTSALIYIVLAYMGISLGLNHREGWRALLPTLPRRWRRSENAEEEPHDFPPKVLDTSVLIDGRIEQLLPTGFIEGPLVVPGFVLKELQQLADSADDTKHSRGRRGLEVLERLKGREMERLTVSSLDQPRLNEVDAKLLWLTLQLHGKLLTNDYNLSKVAAVQQIDVLNINELANALRMAVLPGEILPLRIMKAGKDPSQGVGYLADGTMVVVDNASKWIGHDLNVAVTSSLQTTAGRMIFAKYEQSDHTR